jgi:energy-coupling factor transporter ATP-binding protein EcfA2
VKDWNNTVVELTGPSGVGKTTFAKRYLGASRGVKNFIDQPSTLQLIKEKNYELRMDSVLYTTHYKHIWEEKMIRESESLRPAIVHAERLKWFWGVLTLDAFLRQNFFPDNIFLLDDSLPQAFANELRHLPLGGEGGFLQHMENRNLINLTASKRVIVRRILERERSADTRSIFHDQDRKFIKEWVRSAIRIRKDFNSFVASSGLVNFHYVQVRGNKGVREAEVLIDTICSRSNLTDEDPT